jgi:hypothetical protein
MTMSGLRPSGLPGLSGHFRDLFCWPVNRWELRQCHGNNSNPRGENGSMWRFLSCLWSNVQGISYVPCRGAKSVPNVLVTLQ